MSDGKCKPAQLQAAWAAQVPPVGLAELCQTSWPALSTFYIALDCPVEQILSLCLSRSSEASVPSRGRSMRRLPLTGCWLPLGACGGGKEQQQCGKSGRHSNL